MAGEVSMKSGKMRVLACFAAGVMAVLGAGACKYSPKKVKAAELTANFSFAKAAGGTEIKQNVSDGLNWFGAELLKNVVKDERGKNVLVSPLSAAACLGMIANGAEGETRAEFESAFGGKVEDVNAVINKILSDSGNEVKLANSVWVRDGAVDVEEDFLKTVKEVYNAEVYRSAFNAQTLKDVNNWCLNKTDGMIKDVLDEIDPRDMIYLINALLFDAKWQTEYEKKDIKSDYFTTYGGESKKVEMLRSTESAYLDFGNADGFLKRYKGGKYSFLGILPDENVDIYDFIASLDSEKYKKAFEADDSDNEYPVVVKAGIPEFSFEYSKTLNDTLQGMGIKKAFSDEAEFDKMGRTLVGDLYLGFVLQKTRIELDRNGTRAAAITIGGMKGESAAPTENIYIILNRPFVFGIIDNATHMPLFLGVATDL